MDEKVLVTGATGFVGSCLVRELVRQKKDVYILVRNKTLNWRLKDLEHHLHILECDLQSEALTSVVDSIRPDFVFHLAVYGANPKESDVKQMVDVNIKGTINLLNAVTQNPFKLFINTGSSSEYGIKDKPMNESDVLDPVNDYGVTKAASTMYCTNNARRGDFPVITFRLFSPYGYYESPERLIPSVILNALKDQPIVTSSPRNVRDFIFIEDTVSAYLHAMKMTVSPGQVFNIGSGHQHHVEEVVNLILELTESKSEVLWNKKPAQTRQVEPLMWEANIQNINHMLQWNPTFTMREGLRKTINWIKENRALYE